MFISERVRRARTTTLAAVAILSCVDAHADSNTAAPMERPVMSNEHAINRLEGLTNLMAAMARHYTNLGLRVSPNAFQKKGLSPAEKAKLNADVTFYATAIKATMTVADAGKAVNLYRDSHKILNRIGFGDARITKDSEESFENAKRVAACNQEIVAANAAYQAAHRAYLSRYPQASLAQNFIEVGKLLSEAAARIAADPSKPAFSPADAPMERMHKATAVTTVTDPDDVFSTVRQKALDGVFMVHLYGVQAIKDGAPSFSLMHREATRDYTTDKAATCAPPEYTQAVRNANLHKFKQQRDELAAQMKAL
jgi:hypothetical protein